MASYQTRQRDPLLDSSTQAAVERRGKEALGLALLGLAAIAALILWSYVPEDPGWLSATNEPARNLMGRFGASVASPLYIIAGYGGWGVPLVLAVWGLRFILHRGAEGLLNRIIFAPLAVALLSVYASTLVPGDGWRHAFGLGGLFGDTVLGAILGLVPVTATFGLKVVSLLLAGGLVAMMLFVTGFDRTEVRAVAGFLAIGMRQSLAGLQRAARNSSITLPRGGTHAIDATVMRRAPVVTDGGSRIAAVLRGTPDASRAAVEVARRGGQPVTPALLQEIPEPVLSERALLVGAPDDDRIRARISDAIGARLRPRPGAQGVAGGPMFPVEPPVTRTAGAPVPQAAGRLPLIADTARPAAVTRSVPVQPRPEPDAAGPVDDDDNGHGGADVGYRDDDDDQHAAIAAAVPVAEAAAMPTRQPVAVAPRTVVQQPLRKGAAPSRQAVAESQPRLRFADPAMPHYEHPPLSLLSQPVDIKRTHLSVEALEENARMLESVLDDYGVKGEITSVRPGPVVTMYELEPAPGLKASRVIGLADDIARSMSALSARVSTVPGRTVIGIELPNAVREKVVLREILAARDFGDSAMRLPLALGKDIGGDPVIANLAKMPHLLIAGTTGSGKSVAINTMILSLLYKLTPEECRLIMIDPKMLELSVYDGIPHLLSPVVTDPKKAVVALKWVVGEMEERYRKMSKLGVRNIEGFNGRVREALAKGEMFKRTIQTGFDDDTGEPVFETDEFMPVTIPYIVVVVDEMADLMMVAGKEIEACIQRLAQMARASGIHLIMATQRPSVDVITGTIKANFPTRISFQVTSKIDSRTILGEQGAEQLLGMGDMLYMAGGAKISRIHGPFVSDEEVEEIVNHLKSQGPPVYMSGVLDASDEDKEADIDLVLGLGGDGSDDALYDQAVAVVIKDRKCSTSYIQRKLQIGYNKAARLVEQMEDSGIVTAANHVGKREILVPEQ